MNRHVHGLSANAFVQPQHHREKKRQHETSRESCFEETSQNRRERSACHRDEQPRKTESENAPRRSAADLFEPKPERLKKFGSHRRSCTMSILAPRLQRCSTCGQVASPQDFFREKVG